MKIQEVIVVEGKNDTLNIQRNFDADTIETQGTHLSKQTLELIKSVQKVRGVIILTDPDSPGDKIRNQINQAVAGCKNAFISSKKVKNKGKVGIENAKKEDIQEALLHCVTYQELPNTLTWDEFLDLNLSGKANSSELREKIGLIYHIGESNAKTCFKRLNMLRIQKSQIEEILRDFNE